MEQQVILAKGGSWTRNHVAHRLLELGIPADSLEDQFFRVEQEFIMLTHALGSHAEWSIRFGEVSGDPEDLQFDIDELKNEAIETVVTNYSDDFNI